MSAVESGGESSEKDARIAELEDRLAREAGSKVGTDREADAEWDEPVNTSGADDPHGADSILIHFVVDGFTVLGQVWYRGQEVEFDSGGPAYHATKDSRGRSWLDLSDADQLEQYGAVFFRRGPWPGRDYEDEQAGRAEKGRRRRAPVPRSVYAPVRPGRGG